MLFSRTMRKNECMHTGYGSRLTDKEYSRQIATMMVISESRWIDEFMKKHEVGQTTTGEPNEEAGKAQGDLGQLETQPPAEEPLP